MELHGKQEIDNRIREIYSYIENGGTTLLVSHKPKKYSSRFGRDRRDIVLYPHKLSIEYFELDELDGEPWISLGDYRGGGWSVSIETQHLFIIPSSEWDELEEIEI